MNEGRLREQNWLEVLLDPRRPVLYMLLAFALNLFTNQIQNHLPSNAGFVLDILIFAVAIAIGIIVSTRQNRRVRQSIDDARRKERQALEARIATLEGTVAVPEMSKKWTARKGLVVLVSMVPPKTDAPAVYTGSAAYTAAFQHCEPDPESGICGTLEHLWLLYTELPVKPKEDPEPKPNPPSIEAPPKPTYASLPSHLVAKAIETDFAGRNVNVHPVKLDSENDPHGVFHDLMQIYDIAAKKYKLGEKDIVADITGGTKLMSTGIALAGIPTARDIQYLQPRGGYKPGVETIYDPVVMDVSFALAADVIKEERKRL